jgi:CRISPR/Cas system-associated exonuclease Cas4 (RecB family)
MSNVKRVVGYRGIFDPNSEAPFRISRSKIDLFLNCERCFWLEVRKGIKRPPGFPFNINSAIDELLKREFDAYRADGKPHPIMIEGQLEGVIPFEHEDIEVWRENFTGIQYYDESLNLVLFGAVDDVWVNDAGELIVVDYKSTSKKGEVTLDAPWQIGYKRQMETYQWLLRRIGFNVSYAGYFVYANGDSDAEGFFDVVKFNTKLIEYVGNDEWVEPTLLKLKACMVSDEMPKLGASCEYCKYAGERLKLAWAR